MQKIVLLLLLFSTAFCHAQFGKNCEVQQFKINIASPGLEYEKGIGTNFTLDIRAALQPAIDPIASEPLAEIEFYPALTLQSRYYHNMERRFRQGRQAYGNSANYIAPTVALLIPEARVIDGVEASDPYASAGLVYGLQRSFNSGLSFSIDVGGAYYFGSFKGGIYPVANLSIGWIVSEKRWCVGK